MILEINASNKKYRELNSASSTVSIIKLPLCLSEICKFKNYIPFDFCNEVCYGLRQKITTKLKI